MVIVLFVAVGELLTFESFSSARAKRLEPGVPKEKESAAPSELEDRVLARYPGFAPGAIIPASFGGKHNVELATGGLDAAADSKMMNIGQK
jgi:hypothetical protein